jgi:hypothetical protein
MIQELATKLMNEFPDYKKSIFKHAPSKITLFGKRQTREELIAEQTRLKAMADNMKKNKEENQINAVGL